MTTISKSERAEALARLREWIKPGDTIHCILRHVSRSGMQRVIQLVKLESNDAGIADIHIGWTVAKALGMRYDTQREGIVIGGCGMDMGFALVYELARTLWPDGVECTGEGCHSNDHSNGLRTTCPACAGARYLDENGVRAQPDDMGGAEWFKLREIENIAECPKCKGRGELRSEFPRGPGVMHRDGGYALRARWL